jgi:hypothetical protein
MLGKFDINRGGTMRIRGAKGLWLALAIGFFGTSAMFGQPTVGFGITGPGANSYNLAGVYTDPYQGCLGCTSSNPGTALPQIFCDDFTDDVTPPEYWTAYETSLSAFNGSNVSSVYYSRTVTQGTVFSALPNNLLTGAANTAWNTLATTGVSQTTAYIAAVILAAQSITAGNTLTGTARETAQNDLSFALWGIFDPTLLDDASSSHAGQYGTMPSTDLTNAQTELENALVAASPYTSGAQFTLNTGISATIYSASSWPSSNTRPQEFITVSMAEAPTPAVLVSYLLGIAVMGLIYRRRQSRVRS